MIHGPTDYIPRTEIGNTQRRLVCNTTHTYHIMIHMHMCCLCTKYAYIDNCMIDIHIFHTISVVFMFNTIAKICQTNCEAVQHDLFNDPLNSYKKAEKKWL